MQLLSGAVTLYLFSFEDGFSAFRTVAIWVTLLAIIAFAVLAVALKGERRGKFIKAYLKCAVVYAVLLGAAFFTYATVLSGKDGEFLPILFWPICALILTLTAFIGGMLLTKSKPVRVILGVAVGAAFVAVIVCMTLHFTSGDAADMNWITNDDVNTLPLILCALLLTAAVIGVCFAVDKTPFTFDTRSISYAAVCVAMSFALSYLRVMKLPQGGSITIASLVPVLLYARLFGARKGLFAGAIYGLLQAVQDPYIIHPAQFILDYPLAFSCVGLAGIVNAVPALNSRPRLAFAVGGVLAGVGRFIMHYLSGVFAFAAFADGNPYIYSLVYQAGYVLPDIAIAIIVGVIISGSAAMNRLAKSVNK